MVFCIFQMRLDLLLLTTIGVRRRADNKYAKRDQYTSRQTYKILYKTPPVSFTNLRYDKCVKRDLEKYEHRCTKKTYKKDVQKRPPVSFTHLSSALTTRASLYLATLPSALMA